MQARSDTELVYDPATYVSGVPFGALARLRLFSSWLGATQIRDPAPPAALSYVRRMMLNMDPPEHSRLRRLLARSFTPRAAVVVSFTSANHDESVFPGPGRFDPHGQPPVRGRARVPALQLPARRQAPPRHLDRQLVRAGWP